MAEPSFTERYKAQVHDAALNAFLPTANSMHFDTEDAWLDTIREWARGTPEVERVWIFGSRVTGVRREKPDRSVLPDLDIAYTLRGAEFGELLALSMTDGRRWKSWLSKRIAVPIDFHFTAPDDTVVWPGVLAHGRLVYAVDAARDEVIAATEGHIAAAALGPGTGPSARGSYGIAGTGPRVPAAESSLRSRLNAKEPRCPNPTD